MSELKSVKASGTPEVYALILLKVTTKQLVILAFLLKDATEVRPA